MVETSLGKLQAQVTKLEKQVVYYKDEAAKAKEQLYLSEKRYGYLENNVEKMIKSAVDKAVNQVKIEYEKEIKKLKQRIFELESRLNINSTNSSLPSSKNPIYQSQICNSRKKTGKTIGGQLGHKKHKLEKFEDEEITEIKKHPLDECPNCHAKNLEVIDTKERDELDFEIIIKKIRHQYPTYRCPKCNEIVKVDIPERLNAENNYGVNVKTLATTLNNYGCVSYNRIRKIICGLTNGEINPSEGYLTKLQKQASIKLKNFVFDAKEHLLKTTILYWDDTTVGIEDKDKACLRVYTDSDVVLYKAHKSKNTEGMDEDGILQNLPSTTTVMHDHLLHNYCDEYQYKNIECNAHITRKLEGITVNTKHKWSEEMKNLLEGTLEERKLAAEKEETCFSDEKIGQFDRDYDRIITEGLKEYKEFKHQYEFDKEENLLEFMRDYKSEITNWVRDFSLPYSNNLCESLIRFMKNKMKISYRFQSLSYAEYCADIMSYTETCGRFGINKVEAIRRMFNDNPFSIQELLDIKKSQKTINL